jgi:hypothetical protein
MMFSTIDASYGKGINNHGQRTALLGGRRRNRRRTSNFRHPDPLLTRIR